MKLFKHFLCGCLALLLALIPLTVPAVADTPAASNEVTLIDEDFSTNDPTNAPESLKTLNLTPENGEGKLVVTPVAGGVQLQNTAWSINELASKEKLAGASSYTLTATITMTAASSAQIAFRLGQDPGADKSGMNLATHAQMWIAADGITFGNRTASGWVLEGQDGGQTKYNSVGFFPSTDTYPFTFDVTLHVDNVNAVCTLKLEKDGAEPLEKTFEHILTNDSNLSIISQQQTSVWKNVKLTATYGSEVDLLGAQVTTAVSETYGIRFISRIRTDVLTGYGAAGIRVVAEYGDGQTKTFTEGEGTTVYRSVLGNVAGEATTYKATDFGASYLFCVTITDIPVSEGIITFTVTPYLRDMSGKAVEGTPVVFTVNAGVIQ